MKLFEEYLLWRGGVAKAAARLGCSSSRLYHVRSGRRPMSKALAESIEKESRGKFRKEELVFISVPVRGRRK